MNADEIKTQDQTIKRYMVEAEDLMKSGAFHQGFLRALSHLFNSNMYGDAFFDFLYMVSLKGKARNKSDEYSEAIQDFANLVHEINRRFNNIDKFNKNTEKDEKKK